MRKKREKYYFFVVLMIIILPSISRGQEYVGLPFLKIGIGSRQAGMGGVFTGVGDDIYTLYWNPGGIGHIRRWQWSVSYNRWFTDVYQASFAAVKQFRVLGSKKSALGLTCNYVGMPSWDATGGREPEVSASHLVAGISLGQRLDWISRTLAIGVNLQLISSQFDAYSSSGLSSDIGILFKPNRFALGPFGLGIFDYGIVSCGLSLSHIGTRMKFDAESTSLPRTGRLGISFLLGRYRGWSLLLASDMIDVKNRDIVIGAGAEIWWSNFLGFRLGYRENKEDLGDFSFGFGIRWDDVIKSLLRLPSHLGDAVEIDVADVGYGDVLQQTYQGSISHYPVAPEPFLLNDAKVIISRDADNSSRIILRWEQASDPDPFDKVRYFVVVDRDKQQVEKALHNIEKNMNVFLNSSLKDSLLLFKSLSSTQYITSVSKGGVYYWAVVAYDLAQHARVGRKGEEHIAEFVVPTYDLVVKDFVFTPTPWITITPEQGTFSFTIANMGVVPSGRFQVVVQDVFIGGKPTRNSIDDTLFVANLSGLDVGEDTIFQIPWMTKKQGEHIISETVISLSEWPELNKENNVKQEKIISVPKGSMLAPDSVKVTATSYKFAEIPFVPEVYFSPHSSDIDSIYYTKGKSVPHSVLLALADRLKKNSDVTIRVLGFIDALSGENDPKLADERAEKVRKKLIELGVPSSQVIVVKNHPKVLGRRKMPANPQDAKWVMEQNRVVRFVVPQKAEAKIFKPYKIEVDTTLKDSVKFDVKIISSGGIQSWELKIDSSLINLTRRKLVLNDSLWGSISWNGEDKDKNLVPRDKWYYYNLVLTDTLGRTFRTKPDSVYLREKRTIRKREIFGAAKFAKVEPVYQFYWEHLMDIARELVQNPGMRVRFEGHACAIGPDKVNDRLSYQRAKLFTMAFKNRLKAAYPNIYRKAWRHIDPPVGFGERVPLRIKIKGQGSVLLGDNNSPIGRYLNRRIMVLLYSEH